jgi:hypothetical protein
MNMSKGEKRTPQAVCRRRYAQLKGKKVRSGFLDTFCSVTGLHRKHAIRALTATPAHRKRKRGPPKRCSANATHLPTRVWKLCHGALRSRSRPYVKNDNPHVEQKNGHAVRGLLGYGRLEREETLPMLHKLLTASSLLRNLYHPCFKLLDKRREGARWIKRFEKQPKTPAGRILESPCVSEAAKQRVRDLLVANDFVTLRRRVDTLLSKFIALDRLPLAPAPPVPVPRRSDELCGAHSRVGGQARAGGSRLSFR